MLSFDPTVTHVTVTLVSSLFSFWIVLLTCRRQARYSPHQWRWSSRWATSSMNSRRFSHWMVGLQCFSGSHMRPVIHPGLKQSYKDVFNQLDLHEVFTKSRLFNAYRGQFLPQKLTFKLKYVRPHCRHIIIPAPLYFTRKLKCSITTSNLRCMYLKM